MIHYPRITLKEKQTWPTASTINQENNVLLGAKRINICGVHLGLLPQTSPGGFRLQVIPERGFLIFQFFYYFFRNFLGRVEYERHSGVKFFSLFLGLSHPVLSKNNIGKWFFNFFQIFGYFFGIFFSGSSMNGIRD